MKYSPNLIKAFLLFPVNVMGVIPGLLLFLSRDGGLLQKFPASWQPLRSVPGAIAIVLGLYVCWITVSLFTDYGEGTPAPFDPPKKLVVRGIYRHTRNPMMLGVWCVLLGESLLFGSVPILLWFLLFVLGCVLLIPLWEEPDLMRRFGQPYRVYTENVPRWIPRLKPWNS